VRDVEHVDAAGDDDLEDLLTEQLAGPLDRNGADAGDLAELVALDRPRTNASTSMRNSARKLGFGQTISTMPWYSHVYQPLLVSRGGRVVCRRR
jgi:hypothetical protein